MNEPSSTGAWERAGAEIGRYVLVERIGEGGMGTIWLAEQREPVKRRVALKVIKLGMDTKQVIARFEAERQALALMDHPHIAKVFDAGATESGRPYFVMEYIQGVTILEYCDRERLDTEARLELFTSVCHAIQHAHQKGIIHRDIKPSNVLVTMHDGVPAPKVIDFGIAKATHSELTAKTMFTEKRQMIGTPAYMSPEQAEMSVHDIDTRSDVYSLGVLLYELLTGTTPFDVRSLLESGFDEMLRAIREDEPHKPSTRISSLRETGTRTAQQRQVDPKRLSTLLRGDLDWIVMKCLEKDRSRRYETANGLAADIQRHLSDEPVTAGAPTAGYRLRKFVRRNRVQVIAGSLVAAALVLGVIGTTAGMLRAQEQQQRADASATKATLAAEAEAQAKTAAQENEQKAVAAQKRAEASQAEETRARTRAETISRFVTTALRGSDALEAGGRQDKTILAAMDDAIADIEAGRFKDDPAIEARLKGTIGQILMSNGRLKQAQHLLSDVLEAQQKLHTGDHEYVASALMNLGVLRSALGENAEAESLCGEALAMTRRLDPQDSEDLALALNNLANAYGMSGHLEKAEPLFAEALAINQRLHDGDHPLTANFLANLASTAGKAGRTDEAVSLEVRALEMRQRLYTGDHPGIAAALGDLAELRSALGRTAEAETGMEQSLAMYERLYSGDHPEIAAISEALGQLRQKQGRFAEAKQLFRSALEMKQRLVPAGHPETTRCKDQLAFMCWKLGEFDASVPLYEEVLKEVEARLGRDHVRTLWTCGNLGVNYKSAGRIADAVPLLEEVHRASKQHPDLDFVDMHLLDAYRLSADPKKPEDVDKTMNLLNELLERSRSTRAAHSQELSGDLAQYGLVLLGLEQWSAAEALIREALEIREALSPQEWRTFNTRSLLGGALLGQKKLAEAEPLLLAGYRGLKEREDTIPPSQLSRVPDALERIVRLYEAQGNGPEAATWRNQLETARAAEQKRSTGAGKR